MKDKLVALLALTLFSAFNSTLSSAQAQNLFVTDRSNGQITEITPGGTTNNFPSSGLDNPSGLAFDSAGNLFVADNGNNQIYKFTTNGAQSTFVATGLNYPGALAFDSAGDLFEADLNSGKILEFTNGVALEEGTFAANLPNPYGLAFNSMGDLFVGCLAETGSPIGTIIEITAGGTKSTFATNLYSPEALAFDKTGDLFVSDYNQSSIFEYTNGLGTERGPFATSLDVPVGLAFDSTGNLYEADYGSGKIFEFTNGVANEKGTFATVGLIDPDFLAFAPKTTLSLSVSIKMFAGIILNNGQIGSNYLIQATSNLAGSNWTTLTNVILLSQPYIYIDYSSYTNSQQFYRVLPQ